MTIDKIVFAVAGIFIVLSVILSHVHHPYWLFFTIFVGFNLLQSAFTGFCPMVNFLKKFGAKPGAAFN